MYSIAIEGHQVEDSTANTYPMAVRRNPDWYKLANVILRIIGLVSGLSGETLQQIEITT